MNKDIAAFIGCCEPDAPWIDQCLREVKRLDVPFAVHFDRCSEPTKDRMRSHSHYIGSTSQDDPSLEYTEKHKQAVFDLLCLMNRFQWLIHWDIDEVWEDSVADKLQQQVLGRSETHLRIIWANMWEDHYHIRSDDLMRPGRRVKLYNVSGGKRWHFDHPIINGCKLLDKDGTYRVADNVEGDTDIVCLHSGLMTDHWRAIHRDRWDRVYGAAVGKNPYGLWHAVMDPVKFPVTVVPNIWRKEPI